MSRDAVALGRPLEQGPGAPPDPEAAATLESMFAALKQGAPVWLPSEFWTKLNAMNLAQMNAHGVANFKRTLARNYFTFLPTLRNISVRWGTIDLAQLLTMAFTPDEAVEFQLLPGDLLRGTWLHSRLLHPRSDGYR